MKQLSDTFSVSASFCFQETISKNSYQTHSCFFVLKKEAENRKHETENRKQETKTLPNGPLAFNFF